jgi:DNA-binding PadR family transcriptional regulator
VAIDAEGYRIVTYADLPRYLPLMVVQANRGISTRLPRAVPSFAVSRAGDGSSWGARTIDELAGWRRESLPLRAASCYIVAMVPAPHLGELEQAILLAVLHLGDEAYGLAIREELAARTGREVSHGAAYVTLDRMQAKELVESWLADPTPGRGGRRKRYFKLTAAGLEAVRATREALFRLWAGLEDVLEDS